MFSTSAIVLLELMIVLFCVSFNDAHTNNFIVGGVDAKDDEMPYQVSLQYNKKHYCSGIVLNYLWVITTAACAVAATNISALSVLAGTTKLNTGGERIGVEKTVVHEDYKARINNIALIKLKHCFKLNKNIQPVILNPTFIGGGTIGTVSGWGDISKGNSNTPNDLKKLNVTTITNEVCQKSYKFKVPDGVLCTNDGKGKGFCTGDAGDPLVMVSTDILIGIAASSVPCARGRPDIYTRISEHIPWLTLKMGNTDSISSTCANDNNIEIKNH